MTRIKIPITELPEFAFIWNERTLEFDVGWVSEFRRQKHVNFLKDVVFNNVTTTKTSAAFYCAPYKDGQLFIDLGVASTPTTIQIFLEFSIDGENWYVHSHTPWGSLMYEDSAGALKESLHTELCAPWMRLRAVAVGTDATKTFTLSLDMVLES